MSLFIDDMIVLIHRSHKGYRKTTSTCYEQFVRFNNTLLIYKVYNPTLFNTITEVLVEDRIWTVIILLRRRALYKNIEN